MGERGIRDPHWWAFGGGALVVALLALSAANPPVSVTTGWRIGMGISSFAMVLGAGEIAWAHGRRIINWALHREDADPYLRPRAIRFGKEMRSFYEANKGKPEMPTEFFIKFYVDLCRFKDRFSAAIGPDKVHFVHDASSNDPLVIEWIIFSFDRETSQFADDILA